MLDVTSSNQILNFVHVNSTGSDLWAIEPTYDYETDCKRGRQAAIHLHRAICSGQVPVIALGGVVQAIFHTGRYGGLEVGFFQEIAEILCNSRSVKFSD